MEATLQLKGEGMNNKALLRNEIFDYFEKCINDGKLNEAKMLIEEYDKKIKYDPGIYSFKAIISIMENNLTDAEDILVRGLILDIKNFDLLYNLAYVYECKQDYINSIYLYNYAALFCYDNKLKFQIKKVVERIEKESNPQVQEDMSSFKIQNDEFTEKLIKKLLENVSEYYIDNIEYKKSDEIQNNLCILDNKDKNYISDNMDKFTDLYNITNDEKSKNNLIEIIANKILSDVERYFVKDTAEGKKVICVKNADKETYIGSKYSVEGEINNFLDQIGDIEEDETIIIFGLTFGDHILALINNIDNSNKVIVIEPKIEIINLFKESENYKKINSSDKVNVFFYKDKDIKNMLDNIYKSNSKVRIKCYSNYIKIFKTEFNEFISTLKSCFNINFELQPEGFDYKLKEFMKKDCIEVLVTGISYAVFAFYPPFMKKETFNFALPSQDIYYDYEIAKFLMNFDQVNKYLKYAIVSLCYYSFDNDLSLSKQNAGILHRYIEKIKKTHNYSNFREIEMLHQIYNLMYSIDDYYNNIYIPDFRRSLSEFDIVNQRDLAQKQSGRGFPNTIIENEQILDEYLGMLEKRGVKPIVVVCPASKLYTYYYSLESRNRFYKSISKIKEKHKFQLLDYFYSEEFDQSDFYDGSHLNIKGAKKFAEILQDDIIW